MFQIETFVVFGILLTSTIAFEGLMTLPLPEEVTQVSPSTKLSPGICSEPKIASGKFNVHYTSAANGGTVNFTSGDTVEVTCDVGYKFTHTESPTVYIVCHSDGSWADTLESLFPVCSSVSECAVPSVANGYIATSAKFKPGDHARVFCFSGYHLSPQDAQPLIRCNSDGSWGSFNEAPLSCEVDAALGCPRPFAIANGGYRVIPEDSSNPARAFFRSGVSLIFYCKDGYRMSTNETPVATCIDGGWHRSGSSHLSCQQRRLTDRCGPIFSVAHSKHFVVQNVIADNNQRRGNDGTYGHGTRVVYVCDASYHLVGSSMVECSKGEWSGRGPACLRHLGCSERPPTIQNAEYSIYPNDDLNAVSDDDMTYVAAEGSRVFYFCHDGYRMSDVNATSLVCRDGEWVGQMPNCERRVSCDAPMNVENANWVVGWVWGDYRVGAVARYTCSHGYTLVGTESIICQANGFWSDNPPRCLVQDDYCGKPTSIANGFFICKPGECGSFPVGTEVFYFCRQGFVRRPSSVSVLACTAGGRWKGTLPICVAAAADAEAGMISEHVASSPFTIVVTTSCTLIGVMVVIVLAVLLRWFRARRAVNRLPSSPDLQSPNPAIMVPPYSAAPSELDRLALIAFADDVFPPPLALLPTYEEAIRCGGGAAAHAPHVVPDVGRRSAGGFIRSNRNEYRPLDNGQQCIRDGAIVGDQRRNSVLTTASNSLSAGVSAGFGSVDTINVAGASDATSTSVTVNTYDSLMASNPSIAPSQRATRGSLGSSSTQASLVGDAAPLLEFRSRAGAGTGGGGGGGLSLEHHDGVGDSVLGQTTHSVYNDNASRIVELSEEMKDE